MSLGSEIVDICNLTYYLINQGLFLVLKKVVKWLHGVKAVLSFSKERMEIPNISFGITWDSVSDSTPQKWRF